MNEPQESHAFTHGVYRGFTGISRKPKEDDAKAELPYFRAGYVVGRVLQTLLVLFTTVVVYLTAVGAL